MCEQSYFAIYGIDFVDIFLRCRLYNAMRTTIFAVAAVFLLVKRAGNFS